MRATGIVLSLLLLQQPLVACTAPHFHTIGQGDQGIVFVEFPSVATPGYTPPQPNYWPFLLYDPSDGSVSIDNIAHLMSVHGPEVTFWIGSSGRGVEFANARPMVLNSSLQAEPIHMHSGCIQWTLEVPEELILPTIQNSPGGSALVINTYVPPLEQMLSEPLPIGNIVEPGTDASDLIFSYSIMSGGMAWGDIVQVPEPTAIILVISALTATPLMSRLAQNPRRLK